MIFLIVSIFVPIIVFFGLPQLLEKSKGGGRHSPAILSLACFLFFISWYLPSPEIQGQQTAAVTHFVGGGIFTGLIWIYIKEYLNWKAHWIVEAVSLLAFVSLLGVANELFELLVVTIGLANLQLTDTSWDLLMNTAGAATVWLACAICRYIIKWVSVKSLSGNTK